MECAIVAHSGSGAFNGCMLKAGHSLDTGDHHWRWSLYLQQKNYRSAFDPSCIRGGARAFAPPKSLAGGCHTGGLPYMFQLAGYLWTAPTI
jgi:hypothetical protein